MRYQVFMNIGRTESVSATGLNIQKATDALNTVFQELIFPTNIQKQILFDSYMSNLTDMIIYAKKQDQSPYSYFRSIKQELLKDPNIRQR